MRNAYRILVEKPEGKRPVGRPRCRSEDNIKMDLKKYGVTDLVQDMDQWWGLVNTVMNLPIP
jgi:hypothetical protein